MKHENNKPYKCDICDKSYTKASLLKDHMTSHTGETPYKCRYCTLAFRTTSYRGIHEGTHPEREEKR